jgi:ligand-binding sensor domain-containing protein
MSKPALSNNVVTALLQDEKGLIWIGTQNGINILDPIANTIQQHIPDARSFKSIPVGTIDAIKKMKDGSIWVMSGKWFLEFKDANRFSRVSVDTSRLSQEEMVLIGFEENTDDEIWLTYLDHVTTLAKKTDQGAYKYINTPLLHGPEYGRIYTDEKGIKWSVSSYQVNRYNSLTHSFEPWITNENPVTGPKLHLHFYYEIDADGNVWVGNERGGLIKYDLLQRKAIDYSWLIRSVNATLVYCLYRDHQNNIWVGTDIGIIKISSRATIFNNVPFVLGGQQLNNIRCRRIMIDKNNTWYAATENYGLLKRMRTASGRDTTIGLSTFGATPISRLPFNGNTLKIKLAGQYDIGYMYDMWYDGKDIIWIVGFGIGKYNITTDSLEIILADGDEKTMFESINQFSICYDGKIFWTAGEQNLFNFDPLTRRMQPFVDNKGNMPFKQLPCWSLALKGEWLWTGAANGLYKINTRTKEVVKLSVHPVLAFGINDINIDSDSSCWISTAGGGVIYYNEYTGQVKQYTNREGLSNNTVCGMLRDASNNLWISTYAGLSYFNRQTGQFTNFYSQDGLNNDEFNRKAFFKLPDGKMLFGGLNGYMLFDPATVFKSDKPVEIMLTRFNKVNGKGETEETVFNIGDLKKVVIYPEDQFFSFYFTLTDIYDPPGNRYFYQLEGIDNAWHSLGTQSFVSFNGLKPGKYVLKVKGNASKGSASVNEISIDIVVKQVFYKTAWFIVLVTLAAAAIIYWIVSYRIRQVRKIEHLRTKIASDLHDDVGSSLVRITVLADAIKRGEIKEAHEQLGTIAGISRGAVSTMKDVIWSIDSRNDTMGGMIQYMSEHLHNMLNPTGIDFQLVHDKVNENETLNMNFRQNVYLTFKEAINNVVKHSGAKNVRVVLEKENGLFTMQIKDDGKGIDVNKKAGGQGLYNMQLRAERLKADLSIVSENGLKIILKVPV